MKTFMDVGRRPNELEKTRNRVLRLYGQRKINKDQHDAGLKLVELLERVLTNEEAAQQLVILLSEEEVVRALADLPRKVVTNGPATKTS